MKGIKVSVLGLITMGLLTIDLTVGLKAEDRQLEQQIEREKLAVEWLGLVRYFHPSEAVEAADWDTLLLDIMQLARDIEQGPDFQAAVMDRLAPLTIGMALQKSGEGNAEPVADCDGQSQALRWDHKGLTASPVVPMGDDMGPQVYQSQRAPWSEAETGVSEADLAMVYQLKAGAGREVIIPLSLCPELAEMDTDSLPPKDLPDDLSASDQARLAVAELWPVLRHFYAYPEVVEEDWDQLLIDALRRAEAADNRQDVIEAIASLTVPLRDGHISITDQQETPSDATAPLKLHWSEDALFVVASGDASSLPVAAKITAVDGVALADWRKKTLKRSSGSEHWREYQLIRALRRGPEGDTLALAWQKGEQSGEAELIYGDGSVEDPRKRSALDVLSDDIAYADLRAVEDDMISDMLDHLADHQAVVLDLRGYPAGMVGFRLLAHLADEGLEPWSDWMRVMTPLGPNGDLIVREEHGWPLQAMEPHIDATAVVLMDRRAISYAESVLGFIKRQGMATLVGEASAGSNGNVMALQLPGEFRVMMTGMRVLGPDGKIFQGRGIQPDIEVQPSLSALLEGRDEVLEAAVEYLERSSSDRD